MSETDEQDRELSARIEALPRSIEPERDLWTGIEARIEAKKVVRLSSRTIATSVAVGAVAIAAAWAVFFMKHPQQTIVEPPVASVAPAPAVSAPPAAPKAIVPEEENYRAALATLTPTFDQRKAQLPAADAAKVETSLHAIETARAATRAALAEDPDDPDLRAELDAEYEQQIQTMNDVLDWTTRS